jgi:APA family basic amino acid/polyamine antiporter
MPLKRTLVLIMLTFYGTGMILGAGIYSIIGQAAGLAGAGVWQGFALAAVASLLTALSYAELASLFPKAGGEYVYLRNAFPGQRWLAATIGILVTFAGCAAVATVALTFSSYLLLFVTVPRFLVASLLLAFFTTVNIFGHKQSSWVNAVFTLLEAAGLILFIWLGWKSPIFGEALSVPPNLEVISSAALIIFAYFGFENIVNLAEETKEPEKTIPRAILLSLGISTFLYIMVSLAAVALMLSEQLALTEAALTDAAMISSPKIAGILGGIALFSTANTVVSVSAFVTMIAFIAVNVAIVALRITSSDLPRPFRVPLSIRKIPVIPIFGIGVCLVFLLQFKSEVYFIGLAALICSSSTYFFYSRMSRSIQIIHPSDI